MSFIVEVRTTSVMVQKNKDKIVCNLSGFLGGFLRKGFKKISKQIDYFHIVIVIVTGI